MKKLSFILCVAITATVVLLGCESRKPDMTGGSSKSKEHVHDDGTVDNEHSSQGHAHGEGPHGGTIVDWGGGKFHAEFTVDHDKQEATVYILGEDEKTLTPIDAKEIILSIKDPAIQVTLQAIYRKAEGLGKTSLFVGKHENLGIVKEYEGSISGVVDGTPYSGNFKEVAHDQ